MEDHINIYFCGERDIFQAYFCNNINKDIKKCFLQADSIHTILKMRSHLENVIGIIKKHEFSYVKNVEYFIDNLYHEMLESCFVGITSRTIDNTLANAILRDAILKYYKATYDWTFKVKHFGDVSTDTFCYCPAFYTCDTFYDKSIDYLANDIRFESSTIGSKFKCIDTGWILSWELREKCMCIGYPKHFYSNEQYDTLQRMTLEAFKGGKVRVVDNNVFVRSSESFVLLCSDEGQDFLRSCNMSVSEIEDFIDENVSRLRV